jgi:hypothetical protein
MTTEVKMIAIGVGVILLALAGYLGYRSAYDSGLMAGKAEVQTLWDADKAAIQRVADAAIAQATKERDDALTANEVAQNGYQTQLSAANASAADFAKRLRYTEALIATRSSAVPKAGSGQQPTATSTQSGDVSLTNALGAALAECSANVAQLDALIIEIKPQL